MLYFYSVMFIYKPPCTYSLAAECCIERILWIYRSFATTGSQLKICDFFQEKRLNVSKFCNFLRAQRRHNRSPAASFANCIMTLCCIVVLYCVILLHMLMYVVFFIVYVLLYGSNLHCGQHAHSTTCDTDGCNPGCAHVKVHLMTGCHAEARSRAAQGSGI